MASAPVAKYFIKDYGRVQAMDPAALMQALQKGPVALGMCCWVLSLRLCSGVVWLPR
jgi:hypothetical protein